MTEESEQGEAPKSAAYHEWAMLLILAAYDNNNVSGLTALKYAGDYQRGARAGGGGYLDCTGLPFQPRLALHPFTL